MADYGGSGSERTTGRCKWFDSAKGYGFIEAANGEDVFVHQSSIKAQGYRSLAENEEIEFNLETDHTGRKKAINVTAVGGGNVQGQPRPDDSYGSYGQGGGGYGGGRGGYNNGGSGGYNGGSSYGSGRGRGSGGGGSSYY